MITLIPSGPPCTLAECPEGFFLFNGDLGFKSEYRTPEDHIEAFCSSGEFFWGGESDHDKRVLVVVQPMREEVE